MQASVDNRVIDRRIAELCKEWMRGNGHNKVATNLQPTLQTVFDEGLAANSGGKRLRALLALTAFDTYNCNAYNTDGQIAGKRTIENQTETQNGNINSAIRKNNIHGGNLADKASPAMLNLACAIEIYQTSALIHDDIIDDSPLRRGRPSAHVALAGENKPGNSGTGLALMLGNMLATASADIAATALESPSLHHANENLHTFLQMQRAVEIGQTLDLAAETINLERPNELIEASLNVFAWKTASYTTIAPLELGLCAAGMTPETAHQTAYDIGLPLGVAFQLTDDLLDVIGTSQSTGKPVGGDIREGKHTVLLADALQAANETDRRTLIEMYRQPVRSNADVHAVLSLFTSTGATHRSRKRIRDRWKQTQAAIAKTDLTPESRAMLTASCARFIPEALR